MRDLWQQVDRIPVTMVVAIAYVTLFFLTHKGDMAETGKLLEQFGLLTPALAADGEWWRMLAAAFLHANLMHIGFNTFALIAVAPSLERTLGSLRFLLLYVIAALGGHLAVCLWYEPFGGVLGGSGALFGMFGAVLALNMRSGRHLLSFLDFEGPRRLVSLILVNLAIGMLPFISNTAHVGGLVAGFVLTFVFLVPGRAPSTALRPGPGSGSTAPTPSRPRARARSR